MAAGAGFSAGPEGDLPDAAGRLDLPGKATGFNSSDLPAVGAAAGTGPPWERPAR